MVRICCTPPNGGWGECLGPSWLRCDEGMRPPVTWSVAGCGLSQVEVTPSMLASRLDTRFKIKMYHQNLPAASSCIASSVLGVSGRLLQAQMLGAACYQHQAGFACVCVGQERRTNATPSQGPACSMQICYPGACDTKISSSAFAPQRSWTMTMHPGVQGCCAGGQPSCFPAHGSIHLTAELTRDISSCTAPALESGSSSFSFSSPVCAGILTAIAKSHCSPLTAAFTRPDFLHRLLECAFAPSISVLVRLMPQMCGFCTHLGP